MLTHLMLAIILTLSLGANVRASDDSQIWTSANEALNAGNTEAAITQYSSLLPTYEESGALHYNLGVACFRNKELGKSLYHFRRAAVLLPRDAEVRFNLNYVRSQTTDKIEAKDHQIQSFLSERLPFSAAELWEFTAASCALALALGAIFTLHPSSALRAALRLVAGVAVAFMILDFAYATNFGPFGVVTTPTANVYSGAAKDNVLLFALHEGAELSIDERQDEWVRVHLADGKRGWMKAESLAATP